ncbi:MAG TPA: YdeI/OmpD-associated family protein [Vicinamibacterales bacterium]|nr:YdeI/OmpD-associated family protein [Vicinamibacterales bacterium]
MARKKLETMKTFDARTRERWRAWLATHHATESEVWLIFHKKHTGKASVAYKDALDEALCHGWIDSLIKRIDDDRYARKFTPRKADSKWSSINIERYNALKAARKLAAPGLARSPEGRPVRDMARPEKVPAYLQKALKADAQAWEFFERLAPSHRRNYVNWIDSAKRDETKRRRLTEAIEMLKAGRTPSITS